MMRFIALLAVSGAVCVSSAVVKTLAELPVSSVGNAAYLTSAKDRPWWNRDWTRRAPILVSSAAKVPQTDAVVDIVVDFGEEVKPEDVRLVTMWETLVDCVAERVRRTDTPVRSGKENGSASVNGQECPFSETAVRILFRTDFRIEENKPFLVYWGRKATAANVARASSPLQNGGETSINQGGDALATKRQGGDALATFSSFPSPLRMVANEREIRIFNGAIEVTFDRLHRTEGFFKSIRIVGAESPNELLERASGYAWWGAGVEVCGIPKWRPAEVVVDNPLRKTVRYSSDRVDVDLTLYAGQPRIDYAYRVNNADSRVRFVTSWACGGACGEDDFVYPGLSGQPLLQRAALDQITDSVPTPAYPGVGQWFGAGWYAIQDHARRTAVGQVFDIDALASFDYDGNAQSVGEKCSLYFAHALKKGEKAAGRGAFVATRGDWKDVRNQYERIRSAPTVLVGKAEAYAEHPYRIPRFDRDFCADLNIGFNSGSGWESGRPLAGETDWATNVANRIRACGGNTVKTAGWGFNGLPVTKELYAKCLEVMSSPSSWMEKKPKREWKDGMFDATAFRAQTAAAHAKGLCVSIWGGFLPGCAPKWSTRDDDRARRLDWELQALYPSCGVDVVYNGAEISESPILSEEDRQTFGSTYWKWQDPSRYFKIMDARTQHMREFYRESKKRNPDVPVIGLHSENGELWREMFMSERTDCFDSVYCEMLPEHQPFSNVKHVSKRLRATFGNRAAHTVHHHFYFFSPDEKCRVEQIELPFVCGVNGFSFENQTYENANRDFCEIAGDFYRFAEYTKLGEKVAKMAPVKNLAVFRDHDAYRADILAGRHQKPYRYRAQQDGRVQAMGEIPNLAYDVVYNPYFTAKDLAPYKAVFIPEDVVFSEALAQEALKYVREGGGLVVEGATGMKSKSKVEVEERNDSTLRLGLGTSTLTLKDCEVKSYGKGRILWLKDVKTDGLARRDPKFIAEVTNALAQVGCENPYEITGVNGQECPFSGVGVNGQECPFSGVGVNGQECPFSGVGTNGQECPFSKLDSVLQSSDEGLFLGVVNRSDKSDTGRVTIGERTLLSVRNVARASSPLQHGTGSSISQGEDALATKPLFVLDVKAGVRLPLTNGTFTVAVGPRQCGFYLIGDEKFTALPEVRPAVWAGADVSSFRAKGRPAVAVPPEDFRQVRGVEFVDPSFRQPIRRAREAAFETTRFTKDDYEPKPFKKALGEANYLHLKRTGGAGDVVFADCAEELKALLKRGGAILFDLEPTGPNARAFLKSVGVDDPYASAAQGVGDGKGVKAADAPADHPMFRKPKGEVGMFNQEIEYARAFRKWNAATQVAPFRAAREASAAVLVLQDKVLGAGKVAFSENYRAFADGYESIPYGNNLYSWMTGQDVGEHAENVKLAHGGPGDICK